MITGSRDTEDSSRDGYAYYLLESSGYNDMERSAINHKISNSSPDEIEEIIQDLLLNQVDTWSNYRLKDINRRLDLKC